MQATLLRLGRAVLDQLIDAETIAPYRMVVAEAARSPELGRLFYDCAVAGLHARLDALPFGANAGRSHAYRSATAGRSTVHRPGPR